MAVWVPHERDVWALANEPTPGKPSYPANPKSQDGLSDNTELMYLSEPTLLHNLSVRYANGQIYTFTSSILIALNPFRVVEGLYGEAMMAKYKGQSLGSMPPHPYALSDHAWRLMKASGQSQSLIISGESGAGKTETAKVMMRYLAAVGGNISASPRNTESLPLTDRILQSNPVLEAFGNAKTSRNNNSSRFGKFLKIQFDATGAAIGGRVETYLLEKSRIVQHAEGERGYHVFYQLLAGAPPELRDKLKISAAVDFHYTSQSSTAQIVGVDDAAEYCELREALEQCRLGALEIDQLQQLLAAILHLGNVHFESDSQDMSCVSPDVTPHVATAAALLGVDAPVLTHELTTKTIKTRGEVFNSPLSVQDAVYGRDALAKAAYSRMFDWLISRIDENLGAGAENGIRSLIGVLDIYGFESFAVNSFEQLCINYANEKLQQIFNKQIFAVEQALYRAEGLTVDDVKYVDNKGVVDLIEQKQSGIFSLLNEVCRMTRATDRSFGGAVHEKHAHNKCLARAKSVRGSRKSNPKAATGITRGRSFAPDEAFVVKHFAGDVTYCVDNFLDKNMDPLDLGLEEMVQNSTLPLLQTLFTIAKPEALGTVAPRSRAKRKKTVASMFAKQLAELVDALSATATHFIRCLKPNDEKIPGHFDAVKLVDQLRCSGMMDALKLMHDGYPSRCSFTELRSRYIRVLPPELSDLPPAQFVSCLLSAVGVNEEQFQCGRSKVFFRAGQFGILDQLTQDETRIKDVGEQVKTWIVAKKVRRLVTIVATHCLIKRAMADRARRAAALASISRTGRITQLISKTMIPLERHAKQLLAAVRIQTAFRGYSARTKFHLMCKGHLVWSHVRQTHIAVAKAKGIIAEIQQRHLAEEALHKRGHLLWAEGRNVAALMSLRRWAEERRQEQIRLQKSRQAVEAKAAAARAAELAHQEELKRIEEQRLADEQRSVQPHVELQRRANGHWENARVVESLAHLHILAEDKLNGPPPVPDYPAFRPPPVPVYPVAGPLPVPKFPAAREFVAPPVPSHLPPPQPPRPQEIHEVDVDERFQRAAPPVPPRPGDDSRSAPPDQSHSPAVPKQQRARTVLPPRESLKSDEELQALAQAQTRTKHARELREQAERDAEAARLEELEAAKRAVHVRQIEQAAAEAEEEEHRALAEAQMKQKSAKRAKELKELEIQRQQDAAEREKRIKELQAAAAKVEADEQATAERTKAAIQQQLAQQEEEEHLLVIETEARVAKAREARKKAEQEQMLARKKAELQQRREEAEAAAQREEAQSQRAALQASANYNPKSDDWEETQRRLLKTYMWRLPTQEELNHSNEELLGETILVRGYGVGTVQEFQKSIGWGFHSSHLIDFSPLTFGFAKKSEHSVMLKRKQNNDTPWLRLWDNEEEAQQARRRDEVALQKRGHHLWQTTRTIRPTLAVRKEAQTHRATMEAELLARMSDAERAQAEAIAASEARIAKAREERAAAERQVLLAQQKAEQEEHIRQLNEAAAAEEAAQRRSAIQAEAQYTPKAEEWDTAERRLLSTYSWRVPTDDELGRVNANGKELEGTVICVEGFGVGLVQGFKQSAGWMSRESYKIDFAPLAVGVKNVRLSSKRDHGTRWLKYVDPEQAAQARQAAESMLGARGHQLWSDVAAVRGLTGWQKDAALHREEREAVVSAQLSAANASEQDLLAQAQERITKARKEREARDRELLLAKKKEESEKRLRELNAAAEKEEAMTNRVEAQALAEYEPKTETWNVAQARLLKTFRWRMPTTVEMEHGGTEEPVLLGKLVCVKGYGVGVVTALKTGVSRFTGSWYSHKIDFTPLAAGVREVVLRTNVKKGTKWLAYVDSQTAEQQRNAAEEALHTRGHALWHLAHTTVSAAGLQKEAAADLLHKRGTILWKEASAVPKIWRLELESSQHRQAKTEALAAQSAYQQEHAIMREEHEEVLRKVDVLRSGGVLSDDSDDELELGLDEDDDVTLPIRIATHLHVMARREQGRVAQRVEETRTAAHVPEGWSDSESSSSATGSYSSTDSDDSGSSDNDYCPPPILDGDEEISPRVPVQNDGEGDDDEKIASLPEEQRPHSLALDESEAVDSEKLKREAESDEDSADGSNSESSSGYEASSASSTSSDEHLSSPKASPKPADRRTRSMEEARSLAAQADLLIAHGEFDRAERVLARAERDEVKAGLISSVPDMQDGSPRESPGGRRSSIGSFFHRSSAKAKGSATPVKHSPAASFTKVVSTPELDPRYAMLEKLTIDRDDLECVLLSALRLVPTHTAKVLDCAPDVLQFAPAVNICVLRCYGCRFSVDIEDAPAQQGGGGLQRQREEVTRKLNELRAQIGESSDDDDDDLPPVPIPDDGSSSDSDVFMGE